MEPTTLDALREHNCVLADGSVDTAAVVAILVDALESGHVAHSLNDVADAAVTAGQLGVDLFGSDDPDLTKLLGRLLATGVTGKVQTALSNGYMLCGTRSKVQVALPGGELRSFTVSTRFLSDDPDTLALHVLAPAARRAVNAATRAARVGGTVAERRPEMAGQIEEWTGQLQLNFQTALGTGGDA